MIEVLNEVVVVRIAGTGAGTLVRASGANIMAAGFALRGEDARFAGTKRSVREKSRVAAVKNAVGVIGMIAGGAPEVMAADEVAGIGNDVLASIGHEFT